ncbi:MAG TPA: cohesin domain-containing protein [Acetivibrio sp.]|uniref:cohesin domain-containing protein n=1 Tax=Acetivibrio sp. TaxID=1872092 RepID=UPI002CA9564F|nr:cohesin domain-containing protein [Acetivibrio sp.]HOM01738.1 cohesin domain-containing protein [Acetivibrio sp.]
MKKGISIILVIAILMAMTSSFAVSAYPTATLSAASMGSISLEFDKTTAKVGDIIKAYVKINDINNFAGFQVNIKYDPTVLQAVNPDTKAPMGEYTMPKDGNVLVNPEYGAISGVLNKVEEGIINFGKAYTYIKEYKLGNSPEKTGVLAEIGFKVLKEQPTTVKFENSPSMPNSISGTMLFDWDTNIISDYTVVQSPIINSSTVIPSPTVAPSKGSVKMELSKNAAFVGDIIIAEIKVDNFDSIAGCQFNIKYDPKVLQPIDLDTNTPYGKSTMPKEGTILANADYGVISAVTNDVEEGILNFGKCYTYLDIYRASGAAEKSGTIAQIAFKALKATSSTYIEFADTLLMPGSISGTMIFDWNTKNVLGYRVIQAGAVSISEQTVKPSPTVTQTASPKPTPTQTPVPSTTPDSNASIRIELDKYTVKVGDIVKAFVKVDGFDSLGGFQLNIKFNPDLLQAVNPDTGEPIKINTVPKSGDLISNNKYGIISVAVNEPSQGILNFAKTYSNINEYKNSGRPEVSGTLAVIGFKALKEGDASIRFEDSISMPTSLSGSILLDWDLVRISDYKVVQPENLKITGSTVPSQSPTPSATPVTPKPTATETEKPVSDGQIELKLDKDQAKVGDIIKAAVNISDINNFAGFQVNIKYDPSVLQAVNPVTGEPMTDKTMPADGNVLVNTEYGVISAVANETSKGILNFGKAYTYLNAYKLSNNPEKTGTIAVIGFKVLKEQDTYIAFENSVTMPSSISGTYLFDWNANMISGYKVVNPGVIKISKSDVPTPSSTPSVTPTPTGPVSTDSYIKLELDKNNAAVGDIIKATVKVNNIKNLAGYQINIKYDPNVLQPVNPNTGAAYTARTLLADGQLLVNSQYGVTSIAVHDLANGALNFSQIYTFMDEYKKTGKAEETGVLGVIGFKVLKNEKTTIGFADSISMPGSISGTYLLDWNASKKSDYKVIQPEPINAGAVSTGSYVKLEFNKSNAEVGEIINATVKVNSIKELAGYQICIKYDPNVLQPVNPTTGAAYSARTSLANGELILNSRYGSTSVASHNLSNGILNFARTYLYMNEYKNSGKPEETGVLGVIGFKVLKKEKTYISFYKDENLMPASVSGTYFVDWNSSKKTDYEVIQPGPINSGI